MPEMAEEREVHDLAELLQVGRAGEGKDAASVADIQEVIGIRSFGSLLLAAGLIVLTPVGGIPAVPTAMAVVVVLVAGQLLVGLRSFWLP